MGLPLVGNAADAVSCASLAFDEVKRESRGPPVGRQRGRRGELTKVKDRLHVLTTTALSWKPRPLGSGSYRFVARSMAARFAAAVRVFGWLGPRNFVQIASARRV